MSLFNFSNDSVGLSCQETPLPELCSQEICELSIALDMAVYCPAEDPLWGPCISGQLRHNGLERLLNTLHHPVGVPTDGSQMLRDMTMDQMMEGLRFAMTGVRS